MSLRKLKYWYTFKNNKKYRQHEEKPEYVILEVAGNIFGNLFIYLWNMSDQLQRKVKSSNHAKRQMTYLLERTIHEYIAYDTDCKKNHLLFEVCSWWNINISKL